MNEQSIRFRARILRKQPDLPRYIVVHSDHVKGRKASFQALVSLNGSAPFARNIQPWGKGSDVYFFNLTAPQCAKCGLDTGDMCDVRVEPQPLVHRTR